MAANLLRQDKNYSHGYRQSVGKPFRSNLCISAGLSMHQKRQSIGLINRGGEEEFLQHFFFFFTGELGKYEVLCYHWFLIGSFLSTNAPTNIEISVPNNKMR